MIRAAVGLATTAIVVAGCSSGGGTSGSGGSHVDCLPVTTVRTFDSADALTNTLQLSLGPGASQTNAVLHAATRIQVTTRGAAATDDLWGAVGQHFGTTVARAGQQIGVGDAAYTGTVSNRGSDNRTYVLYQSVKTYSGRFTSSCAGRSASGTYVTYGNVRQGVYPCGSTVAGDLATLAKRYC